MSASEKSLLTAFVSFLGVLATIFGFSGRMVYDSIVRIEGKIDAATIDARNAQNKINDTFTIEIHAINERVDWLYKNGRYVATDPWPQPKQKEYTK